MVASPVYLFEAAMTSQKLLDQVPANIFNGLRSRDVLVAQVLLDNNRHSPGVIDGLMGGNTSGAIKAFQRANGLAVDGKLTSDLLEQLRADYSGNIIYRYKITSEDVAGPFVTLPRSMAEKSKLDMLGYGSPVEALAEKFHMAESLLEALNPGIDFGMIGTEISVVEAGDVKLSGAVARIEVDKKASAVRAYASDGELLATYPATVGSSTFPSPSGKMQVKAVAPAPKYYFDPKGREWGPDKRLTIAAGPNNPVGSTWIDLSEDGYGIHGSPDPELIGRTASHGCVRLTNWDAAELGKAVSDETLVVFV